MQCRKDHVLLVVFINNEKRLFDVKPYLVYPVYEKLKDEACFAKAKVREGIVVWDDETDLDPDRLYLESQPVAAMQQ